MKKYVIGLMIIVSFFVISGCSNKQIEIPEKPIKDTEDSTESKKIVDAFKVLGDSTSIDLKEMSAYLNDNIAKVSPENSDLMLQIYEKAQRKVLPTYQDTFLAKPVQSILLKYTIEELRQNLVKEDEIRTLLTEAMSFGYRIEAVEGTVAPYVDYGYFAQFKEYTTASTGSFYSLMKSESDYPSQKDGGLLITWDEVLQRATNFEAYIKDYPNSYYLDKANTHLEGYKYVAINGTPNGPLFDYDTNMMNSDAVTAYTEFVNKGQQTEFAKLIKTYLSLLETHNFVKTVEVETFMNEQK